MHKKYTGQWHEKLILSWPFVYVVLVTENIWGFTINYQNCLFVSSIGIHNANTVQSLSVFHSRSTIKDSDFFETPQDPVKMSKAHPDRQMATNSDPPGETKMYRCDCGRKFSLLANLTYHSRWECGRIYDCPHCLKQYKSVSSFRRHLFTCERLLLEPSTTE